ncbi:lipopolysaccharide biosynthesis protein [uncultured Treponema sp.]|uniref:lipopolysaccharide biosynthesis protein n=1 Tax=uncultured Treponema sp. TaxID=162155 RepID=UPI00258C6CA2|nr:lipopolysaccharide biosynthesis protein [uncultured Treponema sp.]
MNEEIQSQNTTDDEISLIDLFAVLLHYKLLIIITTVAAMIFAVTISVISLKLPAEKSFLPNEYTPKALLLINDTTGGGVSSSMSSLASLAGINLSSSGGGISYSSLATYLAGTDSFLDSIVDEFNLINKWKIEKHVRTESRKVLKKKLVASFDEDSGVFSISFTDIDPNFACEVVEYAVSYMEKRFRELGVDKNEIKKENLEKNITSTYSEIERLRSQIMNLETEAQGYSGFNIPSITMETTRIEMEITAQTEVYKQMKTQYELLKVEMQSETPILQVLEYASVPDQKSGPSRGTLCIIITFAAAFISVFLAFLLNALKNIRNDPEAMAKLRSGK